MNKRLTLLLSFLVLAVAPLSGCETTGVRTISPVAVAGVPFRLGHFASLNPDCSLTGAVVVRVVKAPDHGRVTVLAGKGYTNFVAANPRQHCNFRATPGVNAVYTSDPGYVGPDSAALDIIFPTGEERQYTFALNVKS